MDTLKNTMRTNMHHHTNIQFANIQFGAQFNLTIAGKYSSTRDYGNYTYQPDVVANIVAGLQTISSDVLVLSPDKKALVERGVPEEIILQKKKMSTHDKTIRTEILTDEDAFTVRTEYQAFAQAGQGSAYLQSVAGSNPRAKEISI